MGWIVLSILTALFESGKDIVSKIRLGKFDAIIIAWALRLYSIPILLGVTLFLPIPIIETKFWWALLIGGILNVWATILYMKALETSDLSAVAPLIAFTPLLLLFTAPLIAQETPTIIGAAGVVLIACGSVILNINGNRNIWQAIKHLFKSKGSRYMITVSIIWSVTSAIDKVGIMSSSPLFWATSANIFIALAMAPIVLLKFKGEWKQAVTGWVHLLPIGLLGAFTLISQMLAVSMTNVAYVIAIKRLSIVLSVLAGGLFLKEKGLKNRLTGAAIMALGVAAITLYGLE